MRKKKKEKNKASKYLVNFSKEFLALNRKHTQKIGSLLDGMLLLVLSIVRRRSIYSFDVLDAIIDKRVANLEIKQKRSLVPVNNKLDPGNCQFSPWPLIKRIK